MSDFFLVMNKFADVFFSFYFNRKQAHKFNKFPKSSLEYWKIFDYHNK